MLPDNYIKDSEIIVFVDSNLFSADSIFKCLYWYGAKFHTTISKIDDGGYKISISPLANAGINTQDLEFYQQKLERDLIDFNLRDIISKETKNVRDLLVAKAFSNGEFDEEQFGDVSDPVGFSTDDIS
jgi:His-Xaa-Ser system protein HxsD